MIPVVLDTNVLVASLLRPDGDHARLLQKLGEAVAYGGTDAT